MIGIYFISSDKLSAKNSLSISNADYSKIELTEISQRPMIFIRYKIITIGNNMIIL